MLRMSDVRLYCVELRTTRWAELVTWYRDVIGLRVAVRMTGRQYALLTGREGRLAVLGRDRADDDGRRWNLVFETPDLEAVRLRLAAAGSPIEEPPADFENYRDLVTTDPDGNRVRFFAWPEE
jgi:predicted enzyme related to lactoylglutathione lyase